MIRNALTVLGLLLLGFILMVLIVLDILQAVGFRWGAF